MEEEHFTLKVIGFFHGNTTSKHRAPRQPDATLGIDGTIELMKGQDFEQALQDLETFSHIWLIYGFHSAKGWKPMVLPPRGDKKGAYLPPARHIDPIRLVFPWSNW